MKNLNITMVFFGILTLSFFAAVTARDARAAYEDACCNKLCFCPFSECFFEDRIDGTREFKCEARTGNVFCADAVDPNVCPLAEDMGSDKDEDGICDFCDNCPDLANGCPRAAGCDDFDQLAGQEDKDADLAGDLCDNCEFVPNRDQADSNHDGVGDACEAAQCTPGAGQEAETTNSTGCALAKNATAVPSPGLLLIFALPLIGIALLRKKQGRISQVRSKSPHSLWSLFLLAFVIFLAAPIPEARAQGCCFCPENGCGFDVEPPNVFHFCESEFFPPDNCDALPDSDNDGICDLCDNCVDVPNGYVGGSVILQNPDYDNDGVGDACDNCPSVWNPDQNPAACAGLVCP